MTKLKLNDTKMTKLKLKVEKGGQGSGNFGHAGRPGKVGGSAPGGGGKGYGKKVEGSDKHTMDVGIMDVMDDDEHMITVQVTGEGMPTVDEAEFFLFDVLLSNTEIEDIQFDDFEDFVGKFKEAKGKKIKVVLKEPLRTQLESFIDCVENGVAPPVPSEEALWALRTAVLATESIRIKDGRVQ